jgi:phosphoribosylaminoimidazole carboxylase PurE protein
MAMAKPVVAILMGSKNDAAVMAGAAELLREFAVAFEMRVMSAHRTPGVAAAFAGGAAAAGLKVLICAAGMAAHLAGAVAAQTTLPVIGVPLASEPFNGLDALLATVQMPPGIPVATVTVGKAGARNAALLAVSILALSDPALAKRLKAFRAKQAESVQADDARLRQEAGA